MKILVTGGAGYIGSHTVEQLVEAGHEVSVLDKLDPLHKNHRTRYFIGDVTDTVDVEKILRVSEADTVLHLASLTSAAESQDNPDAYRDGNSVDQLIAAMVRTGRHKIVFASSAAVYGDCHEKDEDDFRMPLSVYGETKVQAETMLYGASLAFGFSVISLRYFNVAGSELPVRRPTNHLIPAALNVARKSGRTLPIYGAGGVRDYVFVGDVVRANMLAIDRLGSPGFSAFNIGTACGSTVEEVVSACSRVVGVPIAIEERDARDCDPLYSVANIKRAKEVLGWEPWFTRVEAIINSYWRCLLR